MVLQSPEDLVEHYVLVILIFSGSLSKLPLSARFLTTSIIYVLMVFIYFIFQLGTTSVPDSCL